MPYSDLQISAGRLAAFKRALFRLHRWFDEQARDLPWRRSRDPYAIWVSEVMLQQTQVVSVIPYFEKWLEAFPSVQHLAAADDGEVLRLWEGLGYYSRARNLHAAARQICEQHEGVIPADAELFGALPGVGTYTTAAVMSLAFDLDLAVVDGNVRRVLTRLVALQADPTRAPFPRAIADLAEALLPAGGAARHNQAMMELGALICTPRGPRCDGCPLRGPCLARQRGDPEAFPVRRPRKPIPHHQVAIGLVFSEGKIFIDRRPPGGLLGGLWEFPGGKIKNKETVEEALARELDEELGMVVEIGDALPTVDHAYSHFRVTLHPRIAKMISMPSRAAEMTPWQLVDPERLADFAMPRANRKVLAHLHNYLAESFLLFKGSSNHPASHP